MGCVESNESKILRVKKRGEVVDFDCPTAFRLPKLTGRLENDLISICHCFKEILADVLHQFQRNNMVYNNNASVKFMFHFDAPFYKRIGNKFRKLEPLLNRLVCESLIQADRKRKKQHVHTHLIQASKLKKLPNLNDLGRVNDLLKQVPIMTDSLLFHEWAKANLPPRGETKVIFFYYHGGEVKDDCLKQQLQEDLLGKIRSECFDGEFYFNLENVYIWFDQFSLPPLLQHGSEEDVLHSLPFILAQYKPDTLSSNHALEKETHTCMYCQLQAVTCESTKNLKVIPSRKFSFANGTEKIAFLQAFLPTYLEFLCVNHYCFFHHYPTAGSGEDLGWKRAHVLIQILETFLKEYSDLKWRSFSSSAGTLFSTGSLTVT